MLYHICMGSDSAAGLWPPPDVSVGTLQPEGTCSKDRCELKRLKYSAIKTYNRKTCDYWQGV